MIGMNAKRKARIVVKVARFKNAVRFEKGEGIEKKQENFAEEIASMVKG